MIDHLKESFFLNKTRYIFLIWNLDAETRYLNNVGRFIAIRRYKWCLSQVLMTFTTEEAFLNKSTNQTPSLRTYAAYINQRMC